MIKSFVLFSLIVLMLSGSGYCQNIITFADISEVNNTADTSEFRIFNVGISPGYKDSGYRIDVEDKNGKLLYSSEIGVKLIVHKKNFKLPGSNKEEWDYETEVKSNDIWTDEYMEIGDCSNSKYLSCLLRLKKNERYRILIIDGGKVIFEKEILN